MKRALMLSLLTALLGGCVVTPYGYRDRDDYDHRYAYRGRDDYDHRDSYRDRDSYDSHGYRYGYSYHDHDHGS